MTETELYGPVKRFLEARGFAVKGEIRGCDLVDSDLERITLSAFGERPRVGRAVHLAAACGTITHAPRTSRTRSPITNMGTPLTPAS